MATPTLHQVALDVLADQRRAAGTMLETVRKGYARAYRRLDDVWARSLQQGPAARLDDGLKQRLVDAEKRLSHAAVGGIARVTSFIDERVGRTVDGVARGLRSDAARKVYATPAYRALSRISMPVARLSLAVSGSVADGVERLAARVGGPKPAATTAQRVGRATPAKKAARRTAAAKPAVKATRRRAAA